MLLRIWPPPLLVYYYWLSKTPVAPRARRIHIYIYIYTLESSCALRAHLILLDNRSTIHTTDLHLQVKHFLFAAMSPMASSCTRPIHSATLTSTQKRHITFNTSINTSTKRVEDVEDKAIGTFRNREIQ